MTSNSDAIESIEIETPVLTISMAENDLEIGVASHENASSGIDPTHTSLRQLNTTEAHIMGENDNKGSTNPTSITLSYPQVDFPFTFYSFISALSISHPHIVEWSECGTYFKIDRQAKELPSLIGQHFQHSVYQSLRRQMNMYGFHLTDNPEITKSLRHSNWWCREGGHFSRENPQLSKIRPRRRPERTIPVFGTTTSKRPADKREIKTVNKDVKETSSRPSSTTATGKRRVQLYVKGNPSTSVKIADLNIKQSATHENQTIADPAVSKTIASDVPDVTSNVPAKIPAAKNLVNFDHSHDMDDSYFYSGSTKRAPTLSQSFPKLLHQFISDCAISNPDIVQWNTNHTAFNVEIHHPGLPALLLKYFQRMLYFMYVPSMNCDRREFLTLFFSDFSNATLWGNGKDGNYSSLRRQLNFYGFRRDDEGFYRNENFSEGNYRNIVSRATKERKRTDTGKLPLGKHSDIYDNDDLSSIFDHDLSTYDTLKNDDMSFEHMDDKGSDDRSIDPLNDQENDSTKAFNNAILRKFNVNDKVYVRDKDGVLYVAIIRRYLYGPQFHKQVEMGLVDSMDEAKEKLKHDELEQMWHYFVHFDFWNVNFDRWVSESDVFLMSEEVTNAAQRISSEHRALQLEMRKPKTKGKKSFQTVNGATFLREWKKRLQKIQEELGFDQRENLPDEDTQAISDESDHLSGKPTKCLAWTKAALSVERKYRQQGLTSRKIPNLTNGIMIPFTLKKILVQQWEYVNQCQMMPCIPAHITIRQALNKYLESKNISYPSPAVVTVSEAGNAVTSNNSPHLDREGNVADPSKSDTSADLGDSRVSKNETNHDSRDDGREQEWRDMTDGIAMLFDESLESRLLYHEELPQLYTICGMPEYSMVPYSDLYGCEHLLRLFIRLPEMLVDNLPDDEGRQIMGKVNDFIRFIHKNQSSILTQTHRKLNELEKSGQQKVQKQEEKKRKEHANDDDIVPSKKFK